jgi:predicted phosphoribosyltransferase
MDLFEDRREAGKKLSKHLKNKIDIDSVVVPYPDACKIGLKVAESQDADVSVRLSDFLSSPAPPYVNIGAVAEDGTLWIEDSLKEEMDVSKRYIKSAVRIQSKFLEMKSIELARENLEESSNVVVVSDGVSSGFREAAVAGSLLKQGVERVFIAAPVKSDNVMADLSSVSEGIYSIQNISFLSSADECYNENSESPEIKQKKHLAAR